MTVGCEIYNSFAVFVKFKVSAALIKHSICIDQIFIGWGVGTLGNSATNAIFPLTMVITAFSLLLGDGGAAYLSLELGRQNQKKAQKGVNNTLSWLIIAAVFFLIICAVFLRPLIGLFGATPDNLPYALAYGKIVILGFPFVIIGSGMCSLIRADGTPQLTMIGMIVGCVSNIILDAIFVLGFHWGMEGAAIATIIGQILNFLLCVGYIPRFKTVKITLTDMKPQFSLLKKISGLGVSSFISQIAIAMKFNTILVSLATGIGTGSQPIIGYNYGSGNYTRVKKSFSIAAKTATLVAVIFFFVFQLFPQQLTSMFGDQGALYNEFSVMSLRIFPMLCFFNGFQIVVAIFFQSIGKPVISGIISLSRQILFLIPAIMILCSWIGITGVLWAGPIADGLAFLLALIFLLYELKKMKGNENYVREP